MHVSVRFGAAISRTSFYERIGEYVQLEGRLAVTGPDAEIPKMIALLITYSIADLTYIKL